MTSRFSVFLPKSLGTVDKDIKHLKELLHAAEQRRLELLKTSMVMMECGHTHNVDDLTIARFSELEVEGYSERTVHDDRISCPTCRNSQKIRHPDYEELRDVRSLIKVTVVNE